MSSYGLKNGYVPIAPLRPILVAWAESKGLKPWKVYETLNDAGIGDGIITAVLKQNRKTASFTLVDELLCAMHRQDAWYGELNEIYQMVNLAAIDRREEKRQRKILRMQSVVSVS